MNNNIKTKLKNNFPVYKLSYGRILHNKVSADLYCLIPRGKKQFIWFTYFDNRNVCVLVDYKKNYDSSVEILDMTPYDCCFEKQLSYGKGTIFNGILVTINKWKYFVYEELLFYKGKNKFVKKQIDKMKIIKYIFKNELKNIMYTKNTLTFSMPIMSDNFDNIISMSDNQQYKCYAIQCINLNKNNSLGYYKLENHTQDKIHVNIDSKQDSNRDTNSKYNIKLEVNNINNRNNRNKISYGNHHVNTINSPIMHNKKSNNVSNTVIFMVSADVKQDTYYLYTNDEEDPIIAYIPDYKTSIMMNKIFRNIKENDNLDLLEESDDEDEFENVSDDKYVDTKKKIAMVCEYNTKFKKWKPIKCADIYEPIVDKKTLHYKTKQLNESTHNTKTSFYKDMYNKRKQYYK